jgi:formylglycine-generating enzyme required for sulfatase activity
LTEALSEKDFATENNPGYVEATMPIGQERLVLLDCNELAGDGYGFVLASEIAGKTGMGLRAVQDCLRGLDRDGFIDLVPLENGDLKASVTPRGRQELAKDRWGVGKPTPDSRKESPLKVVPKGLRSFDAEDKDFFLDLLAGPRRGDGLPESVHFWKVRIEELDPEKTFRVGYIFGPSGCGKSSLVKAGLLPRTSSFVTPIYIEATGEETEARLLKGLRKNNPDLPADLDLRSALVAARGRIREGSSKILLVIDQFEQWYHARGAEPDAELANALRECDGGRVQAILLVRDDFSMALHRFMAAIGVRQNQDQNFAVVDLFDLDHARKVLIAFGRGYGKLPDDPRDMTGPQNEFLDRAIEGLSQNGRVISVRLALLAEMLKGKPWTPGTLKQVGGAEGVGVTFLEETFGSRAAPPAYRTHEKAAQAVLKGLLPETGSDLKGHMRSYDELLAASGYSSRPKEFEDLIHILTASLRLISPTEPEGSEREGRTTTQAGAKFFLLTHDYLVPSIREWLTRKQKETRRGRAQFRLEERAALWNVRPENRHLPSLPEWLTIRLLTSKNDWTGTQGPMMTRAGRVHGVRALVVTVLIALLTWAGIAGYGKLQAAVLVESLRRDPTSEVLELVPQLARYRLWAMPLLDRLERVSEKKTSEHLKASLALHLLGEPGRLDDLRDSMLQASSPSELRVMRDALKADGAKLVAQLWVVLKDPQKDPDERFAAACALASYDSAGSRAQWDAASTRFVADRLLASVLGDPTHYTPLMEMLRPVGERLLTPLSAIFRDQKRPESDQRWATNILAEYARDKPEMLADLLMGADEKPFGILFERLKRHPQAATLLEAELASMAADDTRAQRRARAAVALVQLGQVEKVWKCLVHSTDPSTRGYIVNWLRPLGADPGALARKLFSMESTAVEEPGGDRSRMEAILFHSETSVRRALILALGQYDLDAFSPGEREPLGATLVQAYRDDPDAGIHGAAEWTLRRWGEAGSLAAIVLPNFDNRGNRRWYANSQGQTMALIEGPVQFSMGSPESDPERSQDDDDETPHGTRINRRFAIATKEVTVEQYQRSQETPRTHKLPIARPNPDPGGPKSAPAWYYAAAYCNWLSRQEGLQECYAPNARGEYAEEMTCVEGFLERSGYRLPTEAEWEYACRAGALTSRYYGGSVALLKKYAWYVEDSRERAQPCGQLQPNDLGLFDMLGNLYEWCQDKYGAYPKSEHVIIDDNVKPYSLIINGDHRSLRGGAFTSVAAYVRAAYRLEYAPAGRNPNFGFRPARTHR